MAITLKSYREITNGFARGHHFNVGIFDWKDPKISSSVASKVAGAFATPILSAFCSASQRRWRCRNCIDRNEIYTAEKIT